MKATIGREYADGSGVWLSGFILFENFVDNGLVGYHATSGQLSTLRALAGIVVDKPDGTAFVLPFDTRFYQKFTQNVYGSDADFLRSKARRKALGSLIRSWRRKVARGVVIRKGLAEGGPEVGRREGRRVDRGSGGRAG